MTTPSLPFYLPRSAIAGYFGGHYPRGAIPYGQGAATWKGYRIRSAATSVRPEFFKRAERFGPSREHCRGRVALLRARRRRDALFATDANQPGKRVNTEGCRSPPDQ